MTIRKGTAVTWTWVRSTASGTVRAVHHDTVTRTIKGTRITRHGSAQKPAYEQADGTRVLKSASEVERAVR